MAISSFNRLTLVTLAAAQISLPICGCRQEGSARGPYSGSGGAFAASAGRDVSIGEVAFRVIRRNLELSDPADNPQAKVAALDARKQEFVTAIDTTIPRAVAGNLQSTLDDVLRL